MSGSDNPEDIRAAARSCNLQWQAPTGLFKIDTLGRNNIPPVVMQVRNGQIEVVSSGS